MNGKKVKETEKTLTALFGKVGDYDEKLLAKIVSAFEDYKQALTEAFDRKKSIEEDNRWTISKF